MVAKRLALLGATGSMCAALLLLPRAPAQEANDESRWDRLIAAAKAALEASQARYEVGQTDLESVYRWSRRLMEAELKADPQNGNPRLDHWRRMTAAMDRVATLRQVGAVGGEDQVFHAAEYYVEEAQLEFAR